jgi:hypothetical protein
VRTQALGKPGAFFMNYFCCLNLSPLLNESVILTYVQQNDLSNKKQQERST